MQPKNIAKRSMMTMVLGLAAAAALPLQSAVAKAAELIPPEPAMIAPLATHSLLLDIVDTGQGLVAVGERGHVLLSDTGSSWKQVEVPVNVLLTAVTFTDADNGWAVGHDATVLHTADGGRTWTLQHYSPEIGQPLLDVYFSDAREGYAVGAFGLFLHTTDGGQNWETITPPAVVDDGFHLNAITRLNDGSLFVVGEMGLLAVKPVDGDWEKLDSPYEGSLYAIEPLGPHGAVIVGMRGNAFRSADVRAGQWDAIDTGTVQGLTSAKHLPNGEVAITGMNRTLLLLGADGRVRPTGVDQAEDAEGETGPFNGVAVHGGKLLLATHDGVQTVTLPQ